MAIFEGKIMKSMKNKRNKNRKSKTRKCSLKLS